MSGELGTGYLPSPADYRDRIAAAAVAATALPVSLPSSYFSDALNLPVLMQGQTPSCVSHSIALLIQLYFLRTTGKILKFSPRFLDTLVKRYDGLGDPADRAVQGTFPQLVLKLAAQFGCATEDVLPNDTTLSTLKYRDDALLTPEVMANAAQYKIPGYIRVPDDFSAMRAHVQLYGAISVGQFIGSEWWLPSWSKSDIDPVRTPAKVISGHQTAMVGWASPKVNVGRNSWSDQWCDAGNYHFIGAEWSTFIQESWAIAEIPTDVKYFLKNLPVALDFHYLWKKEMKRGDTNVEVGFAQIALMILGYLPPIQPEEFQHYGPKTAAAVLLFQQANHISPTSADNIGPKTCIALNKRFAL